jgi:hypothetical protein
MGPQPLSRGTLDATFCKTSRLGFSVGVLCMINANMQMELSSLLMKNIQTHENILDGHSDRSGSNWESMKGPIMGRSGQIS